MEQKISEDALKILFFIYKKPKSSSEDIVIISKWEKDRVINAIMYLEDEQIIKFSKDNILLSEESISLQCTSKGINIIENKRESREIYHININFNFYANINLESIFKMCLT